MRLYKVCRYNPEEGSAGFEWFSTVREAQRCRREWLDMHDKDAGASADVEVVEITTTKRGLLSLLNLHAHHPDNG
jgi:hypothetical protein